MDPDLVEDNEDDKAQQESDTVENNVVMNAEHLLEELVTALPMHLPAAENAHSSSTSSTNRTEWQHHVREDSTDSVTQRCNKVWFSRMEMCSMHQLSLEA